MLILRHSSFTRKLNDKLHVLCSINKFHFISNDNITRKYLCGDDIHITGVGVNIYAINIVNYLNEIVLDLTKLN